MIPKANITAWGLSRSWPNPQASSGICCWRARSSRSITIGLADELVFRGGTCLHQVVLPAPLRYSEDLDFVRRTNTGIGPVFDALREVAATIGLRVRGTDLSEHPKMRLTAPSEDDPNLSLRIKIEINTHETSPAEPVVMRPFSVDSPWFAETAPVRTFSDAELISTKIRALYQRKKGRDLSICGSGSPSWD